MFSVANQRSPGISIHWYVIAEQLASLSTSIDDGDDHTRVAGGPLERFSNLRIMTISEDDDDVLGIRLALTVRSPAVQF